MPTHDQVIANNTFPAVRADINSALAALFSLSSNATAPSTTVAGMLWYDTSAGVLKQRNAGDSAWLHLWAVGKQGLVDQDGSTLYAADSVGSDSYAITLAPAITAYATGQVFRFKAGTANTGAASLNVNGLGAITLKKNYNSDLATGDILANQLVEVVYDGTNFQLLSPVASSAVVATQSDQETASSNTVFVTPGVQHFHPSAAKGWINFDGTGTIAIRRSYNFTSLVDNGTGNYQANLTTAFSDNTHASVASADDIADMDGTYTASAVTVRVRDSAGTLKDANRVCIICFGDV